MQAAHAVCCLARDTHIQLFTLSTLFSIFITLLFRAKTRLNARRLCRLHTLCAAVLKMLTYNYTFYYAVFITPLYRAKTRLTARPSCRLHTLCAAVLEMLTLPTVSAGIAGTAGASSPDQDPRSAQAATQKASSSRATSAGASRSSVAKPSSKNAAHAATQDGRTDVQGTQYWKEVSLQLGGDGKCAPLPLARVHVRCKLHLHCNACHRGQVTCPMCSPLPLAHVQCNTGHLCCMPLAHVYVQCNTCNSCCRLPFFCVAQ